MSSSNRVIRRKTAIVVGALLVVGMWTLGFVTHTGLVVLPLSQWGFGEMVFDGTDFVEYQWKVGPIAVTRVSRR